MLAIDGVADRRRAFAELSALGVPGATLRRAVALELGVGVGGVALVGALLGAATVAIPLALSDPGRLGLDATTAGAILATIAGSVALSWLLTLPLLGHALREAGLPGH